MVKKKSDLKKSEWKKRKRNEIEYKANETLQNKLRKRKKLKCPEQRKIINTNEARRKIKIRKLETFKKKERKADRINKRKSRSNPLTASAEQNATKLRLRKKRLDAKFRNIENKSNSERNTRSRLNPAFKKKENKSNMTRMKNKRKNTDYQEKEAQSNKQRNKKLRLDKEYRNHELELNKKRNEIMRSNEEYRKNESELNILRNANMRTNEEYKKRESELNILRNANMRSNEEYKKRESELNILRNANMRSNEKFKKRESELNILRNANMRSNEEYKKRESELNILRNAYMRWNEEYKKRESELNILRNASMRSNEEYKKRESELNILRNAYMRSNEEYKKRESELNILRNASMRSNEEYKKRESELNILRNAHMRTNAEYKNRESELNILRNANMRSNEEYKKRESELNILRNANMRSNEEFKKRESELNILRNASMRSNEEYKKRESELNILRNEKMRSNEEFKKRESELNILRNANMRSNEEYKKRESELNATRITNKRLNDEYYSLELLANQHRIQNLREDPIYKICMDEKEKRRKQLLRLDELFAYRENYFNTIRHNITTKKNLHLSKLILQYLNNRKEGPDINCVCCNNIFFRKSLVNFNEDNYIKSSNSIESNRIFINTIRTNDSKFICNTCHKHCLKYKIPKMTETENLKFPNVPDYVRNLSSVEERMVAPYVPFMQIKALQPYALNSQLSLKGSVVNIHTDINDMIKILPRKFDELSIVQIKFKRHIEHKSDYLFETIKPSHICKALKYLKNTPLYTQNDININEEFFSNFEHSNEDIDFIIDEEDLKEIEQNYTSNTLQFINNYKQQNNTITDTYELNDEVLLHDDNQFQNRVKPLIIAPGQDKEPLPWHKLSNIDELCFPKIFGGYPLDKLKVLTYSERILSEVRRKDRRSCEPTRILFMAKRKIEESVYSNMNICLRKLAQNNNLKAENVLDTKTLSDIYRRDEGYQFLKQVRSSPTYWQDKKKHVFSMIKQIGFPTLFITLSASETKSFDLLSILYKLRYGKTLSFQEIIDLHPSIKTELIKNDPITCVRYLNERFNNIFKLLTVKGGILGNHYVTDMFVRCEFQQRGSVHQHAILYCNNIPTYDEKDLDSENRLIAFLDSIITCRYDPNNPYMMFQRHKHKPTCYKGRKKKTCRFHYPMYMMPETRILKAINDEELSGNEPIHIKKIKNLMLQYFNENTDISFIDMLQKLEITETEYINAIRSTLKNKKIFYKRNSLDVSINPYNPTILTLLESNMDLQGVLDAYAAAFYMVNYVTKIDAGLSKLLKEANEDVENGNYNIQQRLAKIANAFINGSVMSAQEAAYQILSLPLCHSTRSSIYINTVPKENRSRILKNKKELENLPKNSTDIFRSNIFDKYEKRLSKYENYCLADFACKFTTHEHITSDELIEEANENETIAKERKKDKILRSVTYKLDQDPNNYYRENVLLYLPFRNEDLDIINKNHKQLYNINKDIILRNKQKYYKINQSEIETALQELDEADESDDETDITTSFRTEDINILQQVGSTTTEKTYKLNFPTLISKEEIFNKINDLNIDQKKIIMHILYSFKTNQLPLRIFLNGSAGVGKSTVINAIYQLLTIYFSELPGENTDNNKILLCAPSGKAAYLIGGVTCHHAFALPITQCGSKMKDLSEDIANTIRSNFQFIKLIIIDEISMVGSNMFHKIDTRLRQIYGVNKSFGGISIITVGDLLQLPPVMDRPIYKYPSSSTLSNLSINKLWDEFKIYTLTKIMRQQNDIPFIHLLNNMAHGTMTDKDFALLDTRITTENNIPQDAIRLFGQNTFVDTYNQKKIAEMPGTIFEVVSKDKVIDSIPENEKQKLIDSLQHKKRQECGGLHNILQLKIGIKYMITKNIDVQDGLVNGAFGLLEWIEFNSAEEPTIAWLNFGNDKSIGRRLKNKYKSTKLESTQTTNLVPITKADNTINTKTGIVIMRTQFPLTPSEALTIHKSQGETYDKACINLTTLNKKFTSTALLYVAFSRFNEYKKNIEYQYLSEVFNYNINFLFRCTECGMVQEEYTDDELGLCIIIFGTFIHREPSLAASFLPEILLTITNMTSKLVFPWQFENSIYLPGSAVSVAHQFLRCVLHQMAPNGIFLQIFQTKMKGMRS
uniref:ATP-dependent DNA helicase n=1 Tax=Trichogramma kaykai TaxID=54128 RepID=A0ABD2W1Y8_9HYME